MAGPESHAELIHHNGEMGPRSESTGGPLRACGSEGDPGRESGELLRG